MDDKKVGGVPGNLGYPWRPTPITTGNTSFDQVFSKALAEENLKFSLHAQQRLAGRRLPLSAADIGKIAAAVDKAAAKGARDSLIVYGDTALVVSVKNRTVITAMDGQSSRDNVFTNIDSAVIVDPGRP